MILIFCSFPYRSREETKSSWSSSEEALQACEGLIFNIPLNGGTQCHINATSDELKRARLSVEYTVEKSGFYYFIFANENEMTDNFLSGEFLVFPTKLITRKSGFGFIVIFHALFS